MHLKQPTLEELKRLCEQLSINLDDDVLRDYRDIISNNLRAYELLDTVPEPRKTISQPRALGRAPTPEENPWNAISWVTDIKEKEDGKLQGKKVAVKDNIAVAGVPMMNGSRIMIGFIPNFDATVVTRVLQEGGRIVAKATNENLCRDGASFTSYPLPVRNPRNPEYMTGGSSSGCAALVASNYCDMAIGGDQAGSIRTPSSWTGVYGLKPTYGLVPYTGAMSLEPSIDHLGPMASTTKDLALLLEVIAGRDDLDPRQPESLSAPPVKEYSSLNGCVKDFRMGIVKEGFNLEDSDGDVDELVRNCAENFVRMGAQVEEVSIPMHTMGKTIFGPIGSEGAFVTMFLGNGLGFGHKGYYYSSMGEFFNKSIKTRVDDLPETVKVRALQGLYMLQKYGAHYYYKAQNLCLELKACYDRAFEKYDALLLPTNPTKAQKLREPENIYEHMKMGLGNTVNTVPFNLTGHPALNVPVGYSENLPVGMMVVGKSFDEQRILNISYAFETS
jgi:amidase